MATVVTKRAPLAMISVREAWPLLVGLAVLAIPTLTSLAAEEWTRDYGGHEPIVLAVAAWLFWRQWPQVRVLASPGHWAPTAAMLLIAMPAYVLGRAYDFPTFEAAGLWGICIALFHAYCGARVIRKLWFPILFVAFAVPPPHTLMDALTGPLKELVSHLATSGLGWLGLPVSRQGVIIVVAQYQLLVEDACSGMNSLIGLTALSLLYAFLTRGPSLAYSIFLACVGVPVAIAANVVRVALLVLVTYLWGDSAAQGFIHFAAGIVLFSTALVLLFAIDRGAVGALSLGHRA
jgi:exosortase